MDWYEDLSHDVARDVTVPSRYLTLEPAQIHQLTMAVDPLSDSQVYGVDLYTETVIIISNMF